VAYPDEAINAWDKTPGESARDHFVCVQSVVVDEDDALWILDPASPNFQAVVQGGPKLLKVDLAANKVERVYHFDDVTAPTKSYLNDVRFTRGFAFISDSGLAEVADHARCDVRAPRTRTSTEQKHRDLDGFSRSDARRDLSVLRTVRRTATSVESRLSPINKSARPTTVRSYLQDEWRLCALTLGSAWNESV
jgi:hypothetical protein